MKIKLTPFILDGVFSQIKQIKVIYHWWEQVGKLQVRLSDYLIAISKIISKDPLALNYSTDDIA